jgi:GNAT superfamily N-acetyltransferase
MGRKLSGSRTETPRPGKSAAKPASAPAPVIRKLKPDEAALFREHLLRLDDESRYDRFNAPTEDLIIEQYARRCFAGPCIVIAWLEAGAVRGAAELHPSDQNKGQGDSAFSVETEYRRRGVGSALLRELIACARKRKLTSIRITTQPQNIGMQALVLKFGAELSFDDGEMVGVIALKPQKRARQTALKTASAGPRTMPAAAARRR